MSNAIGRRASLERSLQCVSSAILTIDFQYRLAIRAARKSLTVTTLQCLATATQIRPPASETEFEKHCVIFRAVLPDPNVKRLGTRGQKQHGVAATAFRYRLVHPATDLVHLAADISATCTGSRTVSALHSGGCSFPTSASFAKEIHNARFVRNGGRGRPG